MDGVVDDPCRQIAVLLKSERIVYQHGGAVFYIVCLVEEASQPGVFFCKRVVVVAQMNILFHVAQAFHRCGDYVIRGIKNGCLLEAAVSDE